MSTPARPLYAADPIGVDLDQSLYALDSTTIDLCLSLFLWAKFRKHKAAVKMHTLLDLHGNIPTFISITSGKVHDVNILDEILPEAGAFYVMDRGYVDFERLFVFTLSAAFFVVRTKSNILLQRRYSRSVDKTTGVRSDHTVILTAIKWIKQHLRIKFFYGTSENAVKTQIWIAVSVYVLVAIVRKRLGLKISLCQILQILSVMPFEKTPILLALQPPDSQNDSLASANQLILFDL
jgi:hypothetical protein